MKTCPKCGSSSDGYFCGNCSELLATEGGAALLRHCEKILNREKKRYDHFKEDVFPSVRYRNDQEAWKEALADRASSVDLWQGYVNFIRSALFKTKSNSEVGKACGSCVFWHSEELGGLCRRNAPLAIVPADEHEQLSGRWAHWPSTDVDDWCGEWAERG